MSSYSPCFMILVFMFDHSYVPCIPPIVLIQMFFLDGMWPNFLPSSVLIFLHPFQLFCCYDVLQFLLIIFPKNVDCLLLMPVTSPLSELTFNISLHLERFRLFILATHYIFSIYKPHICGFRRPSLFTNCSIFPAINYNLFYVTFSNCVFNFQWQILVIINELILEMFSSVTVIWSRMYFSKKIDQECSAF